MYKNVVKELLGDYIVEHKISIEEFLKLSINITSELLKYHEKNIVYKYISPKNIYIYFEEYEESFRITFKDRNEAQRSEDIVFYFSPEQTGRINSEPDFRSDLYSLGCLFYHMLTGKILFYDKDISKVIYSHISKLPIIPAYYDGKIPKVISNIIIKLLNKNSEDRYLSAYSLLKDLNKSFNMIKNTKKLNNFELDKNCASNEFKISSKIFGRIDEVDRIYNYFRKTVFNETKVVLVYGESGIGKSSVVIEAGKLIHGKNSYFIKGKFNGDINRPFEAFSQAFTQFIKESLLENRERLDELKYNIEEALGDNCDALVKLIPVVNLLLEREVNKGTKSIDEKTCHLIIFKLIEAILYTNKKLTIFIDDFQWADDASIKLFKYLINKIKSDNFMFIVAYRSDELEGKQEKQIQDIRVINNPNQIEVKPLKLISIVNILTESFKFYAEEVDELANVIFDKTGGVPFFIIQFLKLIYNKRYLYFNMKSGKWAFDISRIINIDCTDNVVTYIIENIKSLQKKAIKIMTLASCIGNDFKLKFLAEISGKSFADTYMELMPAVNGNFLAIDANYYNTVEFGDICRGDVTYRFSHDKIRRTIYDMNSDEDKKKNHLIVGNYLVENGLYILEGVKHINMGVKYMDEREKSVKFSKLNYDAGEMALSKAAYEDAYEFFKKAKEFLCGGDWQTQYKLTFDINYKLLRMEYIRKNLYIAECLSTELLKHINSIHEKSLIYELSITYNIAMNQNLNAEKYTEEFLKMVGISLNLNPTKEQFKEVKSNFEHKIASINVEEIYSLGEIDDEIIKEALNILNDMYWVEYEKKPLVYEMMLYKTIELSIKYGNSMASCMAYWQYGYLLIKKQGVIDRGYEFGELAYRLVHKFDNDYYEARIAFGFGTFISYHKKPFVNSLEYISKSKRLFADKGITVKEGNDLIMEALINWIISKDLKKFYKYLKNNLEILKAINFSGGTIIFVELLHCVGRLMGIESDEEKEEWKHSTVMFEKESNFQVKVCYYSALVKSRYMLGQFSEAVEAGRRAKKIADISQGTFQHLEIYQYYCLALSHVYFKVKDDEKENYLKEFNQASEQFQKWAKLSLINYKHKILFVQGENFDMNGKILEAVETYDKALKIAIESDFIQDAAVINEVSSRLYFRLGNTKVGMYYLKEALYYYQKWGAKFKVKNINEELKKIYLENPLFKQKDIAISNNLKTNLYYEMDRLDLKAVIDAYTAISIEIDLGELLKKLIKILVKNAGAQEGYLLLKSHEKVCIEAEYNTQSSDPVEILNSENYIGSNKLSESIVNYVIKTKENVILNNAAKNNIFADDLYIKRKKPVSVLCVPIIYKNKLTGAIYLQNNITSNVFDENKLELVTLLGTQAAISIENALMYKKIKQINSGLKRDVQSRSKLLNEAIEHDKLKNEFFANLSHEFRTPLNLILSAQQMMDLIIGNHTVDENTNKIENYNSVMKQNCLRLLRIVNNLIDITKIDAGFFKINLTNGDIIKIVEDIVLSVVPYVEEHGLRITFDTNVEEKVMAFDADAIERIILNLISNAVKFSKNNSEIFVDVTDKSDSILIKVRDTGIGILKEKQNIIFDRFIQVDKSLSRLREGSGIGLALTKSLVELMGGRIVVESTYGEYSEFTIELPCRVVAVTSDEKSRREECTNSVIEKIHIEFSDIYS